MTTVSTILTDAYRESNLIAIGTSMTSAEETEGLRLLNRYVMSLFGAEMGEPLQALPLGKADINTPTYVKEFMDDYVTGYVPENTRLYTNLSEAVTVNLHPTPRPGSRFAVVDNGDLSTYNLTIDGNGRHIEDGNTLVLSTQGVLRQWFYREDTGNWARLADLTTTDESPFPTEFDDMIVIGTALRINPRHGVSLGQESIVRYTDLMKKFKARYRQTKEMSSELGLLKLNSDSRFQSGYGSTERFERGQSW